MLPWLFHVQKPGDFVRIRINSHAFSRTLCLFLSSSFWFTRMKAPPALPTDLEKNISDRVESFYIS
jgi:hypothetical protein